MNKNYVHGYSERENIRLQDQAMTLVELLHSDSIFAAGSNLLEVGCGVGAQTITLARNNPEINITALEISGTSIKQAKNLIESEGITNVTFHQGDIFNLPYKEKSFDHIFVCFVLEHLADPVEVLRVLKNYIKHGGEITIIEGDHGSTYFYPDSNYAEEVIKCQVELQKRNGGNANIGRELYPLLKKAGYKSISVSPRMVYVDGNKPALIEGFTKNTFTAMIEGIRESAISKGLIEKKSFDQGINDLYRTAGEDGVFCYTFFKAVATV